MKQLDVDEHELIALVLVDWLDTIAPTLVENSCIAASVAIAETLRYFGVDARAVACDTLACSPAGYEALSARIPIADWPDDAWSVGVAHDVEQDAPGYNGHVVVVTQHWLVDATAMQMNRPKRGVIVDRPVVVEFSPTQQRVALEAQNGTKLVYELRPEQKRWRHTPDARAFRREAGPMIRRVRAQLQASAS